MKAVRQSVGVEVAFGQEAFPFDGELAHALPAGRELGLQGFVLLQQALHRRHAVAALTDNHQLLLLAAKYQAV